MNIVGVSRIHNSATTLVKDGEVVFHLENERLSNIKYDAYPFLTLAKLPEYVNSVSKIGIAGCAPCNSIEPFTEHDPYTTYISRLSREFFEQDMQVVDYWDSHHMLHAAHAFYNSGFENAVCIIKDGMGSEYHIDDPNFIPGSYGREIASVYFASYPDNIVPWEREVFVPFECDKRLDETYLHNSASEGIAFQKTAKQFGFNELDAGKVMGMASFGVDDPNLPEIYVNGKINKDLFTYKYSEHNEILLNIKDFPYLDTDDFQIQANFAKKLQEATQHKVLNDILRIIEETGAKKVCLAGGFFLNCVANYYYRKHIPSDVELYIEPISSDAGTSFGAAKLLWHNETKDTTIRPLKSLYLGLQYDISLDSLKDKNVKPASTELVAQLLAEQKIVAIYQGRSEGGPRALGNRSILFDPRDPNGKDRVNTVKRREWFRPFAGTVLKEHAHEWFDLAGLEESPYMMYAVDVIEGKSQQIPAITHVDNTCRVQTLDREHNTAYYDLIKSFQSITGVPILFNTSFNLAGDCIVETLDDALECLDNSDIDYLYLPELGVIVQ